MTKFALCSRFNYSGSRVRFVPRDVAWTGPRAARPRAASGRPSPGAGARRRANDSSACVDVDVQMSNPKTGVGARLHEARGPRPPYPCSSYPAPRTPVAARASAGPGTRKGAGACAWGVAARRPGMTLQSPPHRSDRETGDNGAAPQRRAAAPRPQPWPTTSNTWCAGRGPPKPPPPRGNASLPIDDGACMYDRIIQGLYSFKITL